MSYFAQHVNILACFEQIETLDDMQRSLSTKDSEYHETLNRISEDKVELQVQLEKSSVQITQLKAEQKRAEELLSKAGLVGAPGASGHDLGPVSSPFCLFIFFVSQRFQESIALTLAHIVLLQQ